MRIIMTSTTATNVIIVRHIMYEILRMSDVTLMSYSEDLVFDSQLRGRLSWLRIFVIFLIHSRNVLE